MSCSEKRNNNNSCEKAQSKTDEIPFIDEKPRSSDNCTKLGTKEKEALIRRKTPPRPQSHNSSGLNCGSSTAKALKAKETVRTFQGETDKKCNPKKEIGTPGKKPTITYPVRQTKASANRLRNNQISKEESSSSKRDNTYNKNISKDTPASSKKSKENETVQNNVTKKIEKSKGQIKNPRGHISEPAGVKKTALQPNKNPPESTKHGVEPPTSQDRTVKQTSSKKPLEVQFRKMNLEVEDPVEKQSKPLSRQVSRGDKLITFDDTLNPRSDFDQLERYLADTLNEKEKTCLKDLKQYLVKKEEAWLLDYQLLNFIGGLLDHRSLNPDIRVKVLRLLAAGALRDDFWSFLQMDRKDHHLMVYCNDFEDLTVEEQKAVAIFVCNNFSTSKGSEWLLYGSPWTVAGNDKEMSNAQITSKVAAYSLVSYTPSLQDYGSAVIYNIALKEAKAVQVPLDKCTPEDLPTINLNYGSVTDTEIMTSTLGSSETKLVTLKVYNDITVELCIAVLKYLKKTKSPDEEILYRCIKSLLKFSLILKQDLLSCVAMVQVDLDEIIPGRSSKIDDVWKQLRCQLMNNSNSLTL